MNFETDVKNLIEGICTFVGHIADGGTSSVYEIQSIKDSMHYALKLITHEKMQTEADYEISVLNKLNILVYAKKYDNYVVIIMPIYYGACLNWHLAEFKQHALQKRLEFIQAMIEHVQILHNRNIIHGDVTPGNFIYNSTNNKLNIIDFSWSRIVPNTFADGIETYYWGWRWFNAPEHDACKGLDGGNLILKPSADIYQLGHSMLYILGKADKILYQAQPSICDCPALEKLILSMIAQEPNDRPNISAVQELFMSVKNNLLNTYNNSTASNTVQFKKF